jgi:hypothetical protein
MTFGWFTGHRLGQYLPATGPATYGQFVPCRYIINGQDHAADIAHVAVEFQTISGESGW